MNKKDGKHMCKRMRSTVIALKRLGLMCVYGKMRLKFVA